MKSVNCCIMIEVRVSELLRGLSTCGLLSCDVEKCVEVLFCDESELNPSMENYSGIINVRNILNKDVVKKRGRPRKIDSKKDEKSEPKKRGRPRKEKQIVSTANNSDDLIASLVKDAQASKEEEEEEEVINVKRREIDGITYLVSSNNIVFDINTEDEIGTFDEPTNKVILSC